MPADQQLSRKLREELVKTRAEASEAKARFEKLREDVLASGADFSKPETFAKMNEANEEFSVLAEKCKGLSSEWEKSVSQQNGMDMTGGPFADPAPANGNGSAGQSKGGSPGTRFVESPAYKALIDSGSLQFDRGSVHMPPVKTLDRAETKALVTGAADASAGSFIVNQRLPGLLGLLQRPLKVANLVNVSEASNDVVEWVKQDSFTNAAAEVAEATSAADGLKPESAMAFSVVTTPVQNIAHWIPITRRALADVPLMRDLIDSQLRDGVERRLDGQMVNGNGAAPNLRGILNTAGISTQAKGADSRIVALHKAMTLIRLAFIDGPLAILMHPTDVENVRLQQDANGNFQFGPPSMSNENPQIWGLPIVASTVLAQGTALVGDFSQATLWVREGIQVLATDSHSDFFVRNLIVVLAEGRFAFGVPRPAAFCTVTGL